MHIDLFFKLRQARIPVSITELLTLLDALQNHVAGLDIDDFYYLSRATLVKDERYYDRFDPAAFELPESFDDAHERSLEVFRDRRNNRGKQLFPIAPFSPTEEQWRQCAAKEFGMIAMIDDGIGQILGRLDELGAAQEDRKSVV